MAQHLPARDDAPQGQSKHQPSERKPYAVPELIDHGTLDAHTQSNVSSFGGDFGSS